jgi:Cu2+-exporting ATPase
VHKAHPPTALFKNAISSSAVHLQVCDAIELSRKTLSKIQQNLGWAFCYNLVGIPLAAGALLPKYGLALTPSISGALMGFSSLAVMANSLVLQWEVQGLRNGLVTAQQHDAARASVSAASKTNGWRPVGGVESARQKGGVGVVGGAVATGMDAA